MRIPEIIVVLILLLVIMNACSKQDEQSPKMTHGENWQECVSLVPLTTYKDTSAFIIERWQYRPTDMSDEFFVNNSLHIDWSKEESLKGAILHNTLPSGTQFKIHGDTLFYWGDEVLAMSR